MIQLMDYITPALTVLQSPFWIQFIYTYTQKIVLGVIGQFFIHFLRCTINILIFKFIKFILQALTEKFLYLVKNF